MEIKVKVDRKQGWVGEHSNRYTVGQDNNISNNGYYSVLIKLRDRWLEIEKHIE